MKCLSFFIVLWCQGLLLFPSRSDALVLTATCQSTNHSRTQGFISSRSSRVKTIHSSLGLLTTDDGSIANVGQPSSRRVPKGLYVINAASKWLVSIAVTAGVLWNPKSFRGPFIAVGSIGATVFASKLKRLVNQGRPEGAPFTDPGMPSSHALISFFVACSWGPKIGNYRAMSAALVVSALRVVCGYHTTPQIAVGGLLGALLGYAWMNLGTLLEARYARATLIASWVAYMFGSVLYIRKEVVRWFTDEKCL